MNYTKGNWNYTPCNLGHPDNMINIVVQSTSGNGIARIFSKDATIHGMVSRAPDRQEAIANAHLIAAAPDMYEALKKLLSAYEQSTKGKRSFNMLNADEKALYKICEDACIKTEHAIAKAEGK